MIQKLLSASALFAVTMLLCLQTTVAQSWVLTGNTGTATSKFGTLNYQPVRFYTNNLQRMILSSAGSLGIGVASPTQKLHVAGTGLFTSGVLVTNGEVNVTTLTTSTAIRGRSDGLGGCGVFGTGNDFGLRGEAANFGVYGTGDIGVAGDGASTGIMGSGRTGVYGSAAGSGGADDFGDYGVHGFGPRGVFGEGLDYGIYGAPYSTVGLRIGVYGTGVTGIYGNGTTWAGYFNGNVFSTGVYLGSDKKLKTNIAEFTSAMEILEKLHPKTYQFRHDGKFERMNLPNGDHYGLIAQDVEAVLPDLVTNAKFEAPKPRPQSKSALTPKVDGKAIKTLPTAAAKPEVANDESVEFKSVNYIELIPIMIKGMQEQQMQIREQQQEINQLKEMLEKLAPAQFKNGFGGSLQQNTPNPVSNVTRISYSIPASTKNAQIILTDNLGTKIKAVQVNTSGFINLSTGDLKSGSYNYSLIVDGVIVETKSMVVVRK